MERQLSRSDRLIAHMDSALRILMPGAAVARRTNPAAAVGQAALDEFERQHVAGVVRAAHSATVGTQGFYQGQMALIKLPASRRQIEPLEGETLDHLAWCHQRLVQLNSRTSYFTPVWYGLSLGLGLTAGAIGDRFGLGMTAVTKELMSQQLNKQFTQLPVADHNSRPLFRQMAADNGHHARLAIEASGSRFPAPIKWGVGVLASGVMKVAYYA
ncbi:demethoxyubiquinone hydroxylase family protein [Halomonas sp. 7T]|uniref:3-demethoxyubiquinol 3-hydroxylase n=1 Tax=Halomonas sp. 7T TaxID=2893469 RepID=UPI0021D93C26|nr:demethoxyubiquinone hydroxylase family protein [Halomonas sp. 7T]UXZ55029.1 demethoxyubiquinone hydroxylase family protein [Halomonas sp. 7T]